MKPSDRVVIFGLIDWISDLMFPRIVLFLEACTGKRIDVEDKIALLQWLGRHDEYIDLVLRFLNADRSVIIKQFHQAYGVLHSE